MNIDELSNSLKRKYKMSLKGNNTMILNQACLIEAVQMYLDSKFKEGTAPHVINVNQKGDVFEINLTDSETFIGVKNI